jgi:hypothetical protein
LKIGFFDIGQIFYFHSKIVLPQTIMMKKGILLVFVIVWSCTTDSAALLGRWHVDSKFYRATYDIVEVDGDLKVEVIYYNDDTTILKQNKAKPYYLYNDLKPKGDQFVDAISGATKSNTQEVSFKLRHKDTLEVTTYILKKSLTETWIKTQ